MEQLGLESTRTNVNGGAVALGHPIGASGVQIPVTGVKAKLKKVVIRTFQGVAVVALLVFIFIPLRTFTQVAVCFLSLFIGSILGLLANDLDDENAGSGPISLGLSEHPPSVAKDRAQR